MAISIQHIPLTAACLHDGVGIGHVAMDRKVDSYLKYQFGAFGKSFFESVEFDSVDLNISVVQYSPKTPEYVVCFGAGVDSTAMIYKLVDLGIPAEKLSIVYVNYGGPWSTKENLQALKVFESLKPLGKFEALNVEVLPSFPKSSLVNGYIVPGRNGMLMELATRIYWNVYHTAPLGVFLAANYKKDDSVGAIDKGRIFFGSMTDILSSRYHQLVQCSSPVLHQSKLEALLSIAHIPGALQNILEVTTSCYDSESNACGSCYACFKRNLMLNTLKDLNLKLDWTRIPHLDLQNLDMKTEILYLEYTQREKAKGRAFSNSCEKVIQQWIEKFSSTEYSTK
jgi:7-cyano-7-deazaguanine synthase in queuosine biosynthesis